jgi:dTMP kinase
METRKGKLIVIEGGDGAGKATQTKLLVDRLRALGRRVETISFPQYGQPSAAKVEAYLRGDLGSKESIDPRDASKLYAADRLAAAPKIEQWLREGADVTSDRYEPSNNAHQGVRIADEAGRLEFSRWLHDYEYGDLGIPKPDLTLILSVAPDIRERNVESKDDRAYLHGAKKDILEGDQTYQEKVELRYRELARTIPGYVLVECVGPDGTQLGPSACHNLIWSHVEPLLQP